MSITDPGNAELAITVGSTHKEMPHRYGVSYFSSRGPTGDGRPKPDLLAPGERIISCAAGQERDKYAEDRRWRRGRTACSTASNRAPAWPRRMFPESPRRSSPCEPNSSGSRSELKEILMQTAVDLAPGAKVPRRGPVDLMKALQAV